MNKIWSIVCLIIALLVAITVSIGAVSPIARQVNSSDACSDVSVASSLNVEDAVASEGLQYSSPAYFSCFVSCDLISIERTDHRYELSVYDPIDDRWHSTNAYVGSYDNIFCYCCDGVVKAHCSDADGDAYHLYVYDPVDHSWHDVSMSYHRHNNSCQCCDGVMIAHSSDQFGNDEGYVLYVYDPVDHRWHSKRIYVCGGCDSSYKCCDGVVIIHSFDETRDDYDAYLYQVADHSWHSQDISCGLCDCAPPPPQPINPCDSKDGWYDTGEIRWVTTNEYECRLDQKEEKEQVFQDWYCSDGFCIYGSGGTRWIETGETRTLNKSDGTACGSDYYDDWVSYCSGDELRKHRQFHDFYCEGGSCTDHTSWVDDQLIENCNDYDGWVDTGETRWVDDPGNQCQEKEQKEQEYWDYTCSGSSCTYSITNTQWIDTGNTKNRPDGTDCGIDYYDDWVSYCKGDEAWKHRQFHDFYCEAGSCTDHTSWVDDQLVENCNDYDGWVDTGETRWVDDPEDLCREVEQKEQKYQDYYCDSGSCACEVTDTRWIDTGNDRMKEFTLTITVDGTGTTDPSQGSHTYNCSTSADITAIETEPDWKFSHWSGDASGTNPLITVHIDSDKSVTAHFTPGICGDTNGDGIVNMGDVVLLLNYVGRPGEYQLYCEWCGDVAPCPASDGIINMGDVVLLLNYVGYPGQYELCCW